VSAVARDILLEIAVLPFLAAALVTLAARLVPARLRPCTAGLAIVLGFAVGYVAIRGWPELWPRSATEKLPAIVLVALLVGFAHQRGRTLRTLPPWLIHAVAFTLIVLWLAQPRLGDAPPPFLLQAGVVWVAGVVGIVASVTGGGTPHRQIAMLTATAIGFTGPALFAGTVSLAALGMTLGTALLGILAASRPAGLGRPTTCAVLPPSGLLLGLGAILVMFSAAEPWLLGLAWLALFADRTSRRIARSRRRERWLFAFFCVLPPALAIALARLVSGPLSF
jgi:hypothetical protein